MPINHENITSNQEPTDHPLGQSEKDNPAVQHNTNIGAKILTLSNFETRHKPIVESSFNKSRKHGERLPGKNNERKNYAYLSRLERLIEKYGNETEKRLWQASIKNDLLVNEEDITETTWKAKQQEYRDNGQGYPELTNWFKHKHAEEWRKLQKESLEKWANYLGDEHSPYPLWFKVYAWDGITKMGVYNKTKREYEKRNKSTVAPYPEPDAEILGIMFETINRYHGNNEREFYTEDGKRNIDLEKAVQSGSFAKIYNAIQQDISPIIKPPEKAEDVRGRWVEYKPGDEKYIAIAARNTGWCIAASAVGKYYLKHGTYGTDKEDNSEEQTEELKSRFILFHLEDPSTNKLSRNAVASIRLNPDGRVVEISGLQDGQALDDSLVPTVEEKVKTLPGGKEFLPKFADKNRLIYLDKKMKNGEDLTKEELEFIYEIHRPINTLDTYNTTDPRIKELKEKYSIEYALSIGVEPDSLVSKLNPQDIAKYLDPLIKHGAKIDTDNLISQLNRQDIAKNIDSLIKYSTEENIDNLVSQLSPERISKNLKALIAHNANINNLASRLDPLNIIKNLASLITSNLNINDLLPQLGTPSYPYDILKNLDSLTKYGAEIDLDGLVSQLSPTAVVKDLDILTTHGAKIDIDDLMSQLYPRDIAENLDLLIKHGAKIDIDSLVSQLDLSSFIKNITPLITHSTNIDNLVSRLRPYPYVILENLDSLIEHGAKIDIDNLASQLSQNEPLAPKDQKILIKHGWRKKIPTNI